MTKSNYFVCSSAETGQEHFLPGPLELKSGLLSHLDLNDKVELESKPVRCKLIQCEVMFREAEVHGGQSSDGQSQCPPRTSERSKR